MKTSIFSLLAMISLQVSAQYQTASLEFRIPSAIKTDTLRLSVWYKSLSERSTNQLPSKTIIASNKNGSFHFKIDSLKEPVYFIASKDQSAIRTGEYSPFFRWYLMEPGDNVVIAMDSLVPIKVYFPELGEEIMGYRQVNISFKGKGSAKYEFQTKITELTEKWLTSHVDQPDWEKIKMDSAFYTTIPGRVKSQTDRNFELLTFKLEHLQGYKKNMSAAAWQIMKANLVGAYEENQVQTYIGNRGMYKGNPNVSEPFKAKLTDELKAIYFARKRPDMSDVSKKMLPYSINYIGAVTSEAYYISKEQYQSLIKNYEEGLFRDKLITDLLLKYRAYLRGSNDVIIDAVTKVQDEYFLSIVSDVYKTQRVGSVAYDFSLPDHKGNMVKLSDFKGKVVFIDLWYTGCGACAGFYKMQLSKVEKHFEGNPDVVFITVSIDSSKDIWIKSLRGGTYTTYEAQNVVNLYTAGQGNNHPLIKAYNVMGYPHPFMVDQQGKIYRMSNLRGTVEELIPIIDQAISRKS